MTLDDVKAGIAEAVRQRNEALDRCINLVAEIAMLRRELAELKAPEEPTDGAS